jgi:hypothetical protein
LLSNGLPRGEHVPKGIVKGLRNRGALESLFRRMLRGGNKNARHEAGRIGSNGGKTP